MQLTARVLRTAPVAVRRLGIRAARSAWLRNEPPAGVWSPHGGRQLMRKPLASGREQIRLGKKKSGLGHRRAAREVVGPLLNSPRFSRASAQRWPGRRCTPLGRRGLRSSALQAGLLASRGAGGAGTCGHCVRRRAVVAFRLGHRAPASSGMAPPELVGRKRFARGDRPSHGSCQLEPSARALANTAMELSSLLLEPRGWLVPSWARRAASGLRPGRAAAHRQAVGRQEKHR